MISRTKPQVLSKLMICPEVEYSLTKLDALDCCTVCRGVRGDNKCSATAEPLGKPAARV